MHQVKALFVFVFFYFHVCASMWILVLLSMLAYKMQIDSGASYQLFVCLFVLAA